MLSSWSAAARAFSMSGTMTLWQKRMASSGSWGTLSRWASSSSVASRRASVRIARRSQVRLSYTEGTPAAFRSPMRRQSSAAKDDTAGRICRRIMSSMVWASMRIVAL